MVLLGGAALAQAPATNYDEAKVPAYTLPPLLVMNDGTPVSGAAGWEARRAEIRTLLESQMFGRAPGRPDDLTFAVDDLDKAALGGTAIRKQVSIRTRGLTFRLLLYLPAQCDEARCRSSPASASHPTRACSADPGITLAGAWAQNKETKAIELQPAQESSRGSAASRWQVEAIAGPRVRAGDDVLRRHRAGPGRRDETGHPRDVPEARPGSTGGG